MNASWDNEWEDKDEILYQGEVVFRGAAVVIGDVQITPWDCPECLSRHVEVCDSCAFLDPAACPLRLDPELKDDIRSIFSAHRDKQLRYQRHVERIKAALSSELRAHGRPLHISVLLQMLADRHPNLHVTETSLYRILSGHSEMFEHVSEGVYALKPGC